MKHIALITVSLALAACSQPEQEQEPAPAAAASASAQPSTPASPEAATTPAVERSPRTLALEGLGDLQVGQAIPSGSSWASRGAQEPNGCTTVSSRDFPGAYAIVEGGKVRRITIGQRSDVTLAEGIGVGASEADVRKWFAGFREEPHKYEPAPAKYLTAPNGESGDPALRFEIGADRKVSLIHVGTAPALNYVEGCS